MSRILIVEDDEDINRILGKYMENAGHQATGAYSGTEARLLLSMNPYDLVLLDLMIPGIPGEELIREIRGRLSVPILVISAKGALEDKVQVLKSGADDYMTKPFEREEVLARVEALLRRCGQWQVNPVERGALHFKNLTLNQEAREVLVSGNPISLTAHEFEILLLLLQAPERVFTKEQLYQEIWKSGYYGEDNTINVHISNIRKKLKEFDEESYIKTVWGIGFKIDTAEL